MLVFVPWESSASRTEEAEVRGVTVVFLATLGALGTEGKFRKRMSSKHGRLH